MGDRVPVLAANQSRVPIIKPGQTPASVQSAPSVSVVQAQPKQTINGVVQANNQSFGPAPSSPAVQKPKANPISGANVSGNELQPTSSSRIPILPNANLNVTGVDNSPAPAPTKQVPQSSDVSESTTPSLMPQTLQTVYKTPDDIAWEEKSKTDLLKELAQAPIKDLIVLPGVRLAQVYSEGVNSLANWIGGTEGGGGFSEKNVNVKIPGLGSYDVGPQKTGLVGTKQIIGQGISAASWLYAPEKVVGIGKNILNDVAIAGIKEGTQVTDKLIRTALWNTIKKSAATGAIVGATGNLGSSLQSDKGWTDNTKDFVIGAVFGGALGVALGGGGVTLQIAKNKVGFIQNELYKELVSRGFTPEHANRLVSEGGYLGDVLGELSETPVPKRTSMLENQPQKVEDLSYGDSLPKPGDYVKERGFIASLKEHPQTQEIFKDIIDNYNPHINKTDIANVRAMQIMEPAKYETLVRSSDVSAESTIAKVMYLKDAVAAGNIGEAKSMAAVLAKRGTELGQATQAFATLGADMGDAGQALVFAQKEIQKANENVFPKFEGKIKNVQREFDKIHNEVADQIINETPELHKPVTPLEKAISKMEIAPEERLAEKIRTEAKANKPSAVKDMLNTLLKVANEALPKKNKPVPRNALELVTEAIKNKDTYKEVWLKAQDLVKEKYADKPEDLKLLQDYFNKTLLSGEGAHAELPVSEGMVGKVVKEGIKSEGVDLSKIVKEYYTVSKEAGKTLTAKLVDQAGLSPKDAMALSKKIQTKFDQLATEKKDIILKKMFGSDTFKPGDRRLTTKILEWSNLGAFDKEALRGQLGEKLGLTNLDDQLAKKIVDQSNFIQQLPKEAKYERFKQTQNLLQLISEATPVSKGEVLGKVLNIPRTLMSSFDLSFGLRQGIVTAYSHPLEFWNAWKQSFKMFGSQKFYEKSMDLVMKNPDFEYARKAGVSFTDMGSKMSNREERFMSNYAEKIPVIGHGVTMSGRAYTGMANKLRMDTFTSLMNNAEALGLNPRESEYLGKDIATLVNNLTGRGDFGKHELAGTFLNSIFFSPRLTMSRLNLLASPLTYLKAEPFVRKQALKSMLAFGAGTATILGLAKLSGLDVGLDPRSSDFGKIKIGNTRLDIWGGFQQPMRMAAQLWTGKYVSSTTGKEYTLGEGYKPLTRLDIVLRQLQSKENPIASFVTDWLQGTDYEGNPFSVPKAIGSRLTPMIASDMYDIYKDNPSLLPLSLLSTLGIGVQTYTPQKKAPKKGTKLPVLGVGNGSKAKLPVLHK